MENYEMDKILGQIASMKQYMSELDNKSRKMMTLLWDLECKLIDTRERAIDEKMSVAI